jgi:hypothetical protein
MAKNKKRFSQVIMIVFLALIVIGFTIPGFLNSPDNTPIDYTEPRLCQVDSDCYLICDDSPVAVLCTGNLCQQNRCDEFSYFEYKNEPISFSLEVVLDTDKVKLADRINEKEIFVKYDEKVNLFARGLTMNHVLEKFNMAINAECLTVADLVSCNNEESFFSFIVNRNESFQYGDYIPKDGDDISLFYGVRDPLN